MSDRPRLEFVDAVVIVGDGYRVPTDEDLKELLDLFEQAAGNPLGSVIIAAYPMEIVVKDRVRVFGKKFRIVPVPDDEEGAEGMKEGS